MSHRKTDLGIPGPRKICQSSASVRGAPIATSLTGEPAFSLPTQRQDDRTRQPGLVLGERSGGSRIWQDWCGGSQTAGVRALLRWSQDKLARRAGIGLATLRCIEQTEGIVKANFSTVIKIQ